MTVNLAPADLPKEGGRFDLPIALGILAASEQIATDKLKNYEFVGELALSGGLRPVKGVLPAALAASKFQRHLVVPHVNGDQAALVGKEQHKSAQSLLEVCAELCGQHRLNLHKSPERKTTESHNRDLQDIIGQQQGKRALEIAAAGNHNLLFLGPPGTGKTMLASRLCDLLPEMSDDEAMETASVASLTQSEINEHNWKIRPFRSPHHSSSIAALVGGGSVPRPGEISLAHNGLLFLDEMPGVRSQGAGFAARTAGVGRDHHLSGSGKNSISCPLSAGGCSQPQPDWLLRRQPSTYQSTSHSALFRSSVGTATGSIRYVAGNSGVAKRHIIAGR